MNLQSFARVWMLQDSPALGEVPGNEDAIEGKCDFNALDFVSSLGWAHLQTFVLEANPQSLPGDTGQGASVTGPVLPARVQPGPGWPRRLLRHGETGFQTSLWMLLL